jgi:CRP-like cAMP-binding protein
MLPMRADAGETVVRAGGPADKFLVVVEGELEMISDGDAEPVVLGPGQFYGEMAILREAPRISTLRARTDVSLLAMEREDFRRLVAQSLGTTAGFEDIINARLRARAESLPTA